MKKILLASAMVFAASPVLAGDIWGSLYFDPNSGAWGASSSQSDATVAEVVALGNCEANNPSSTSCQHVATVEGVCVVLATSTHGPWGFGVNDSDDIAGDTALDFCEDHGGGDCEVEIRVCGDE